MVFLHVEVLSRKKEAITCPKAWYGKFVGRPKLWAVWWVDDEIKNEISTQLRVELPTV
jgi:hypothetical protein